MVKEEMEKAMVEKAAATAVVVGMVVGMMVYLLIIARSSGWLRPNEVGNNDPNKRAIVPYQGPAGQPTNADFRSAEGQGRRAC